MSEFFKKAMGLVLLGLVLLGLIVFLIVLIGKIVLSIILLISYSIASFLPRLLVTVLALAIAVVIYLLIPGSLLYLSVELFSKLNHNNYYPPRIAKIIPFLPVLSIITGLSLGLVAQDPILRHREKLSFNKTPCGDNSSKIEQNLHQVFVNKNDEETLKYLQNNYCQYAVRKYRKDKNQISILVASFKSNSKANNFAKMMNLDKEIGSSEVVKKGLTCERSNNQNFHPVFVNQTDIATLKYIRDNYCQDAIIQYRKDIKVAENEDRKSILVTDFSEKAKAKEFASRILEADSKVKFADVGRPGFSCHQPNNNPDKLYPVFVNKINGATLKYIRENYCQDAKIIKRKEGRQNDTNIPQKSILVALFEDKQHALDFARYLQKDSKINSGELGTPGMY